MKSPVSNWVAMSSNFRWYIQKYGYDDLKILTPFGGIRRQMEGDIQRSSCEEIKALPSRRSKSLLETEPYDGPEEHCGSEIFEDYHFPRNGEPIGIL